MTSHPNAGGLAVNWCIFGSNGHINKPKGGVLENYTMRSKDDFPTNLHIKTVCDPAKVFYYGHCHFPTYRKGYFNLDETGAIVRGPFTKEVRYTKIRINHYFSKSREEYIAKKNRGIACTEDIRTMSDFYAHDQNVVYDTEILQA